MATETAPEQAAPAPIFASVTHRLTAGSLISRAFSAWWKNLFKFGALSVLVFVPAMVLGAALAYQVGASSLARNRPAPATGGLVFLAAFPVIFLFAFVQMGALTYGTVQHLAGRRVRFGAMVAAGFRRLLPLVGVGIVVGLMTFAGFLALVVPGVILALAVSVAMPAVVIERIGPLGAIRRSFQLTRDHRLAIFAAWLVLLVVAFGANLVGQAAAAIAVSARSPVALAVVGLLSLALNVLMSSLPGLLPAVAYHDLRALKEGVVTEDLLKVFE
jgi:hypothetical protein